MLLIILIIVLGICWYLHAKKGIKWGHMLGAIGLGIVSIIYWAFKVDAGLDKKVSNKFEKTHNATKEDLVYWATQSNDLMLSGLAERELRRRYRENWRQIL